MPIGFTDTAHMAMSEARDEALRLHHPELGTEHLLLGIISAGGDASKIFAQLKVDPDAVYLEIEKQFPAKSREAASGRPEQSALLKKVVVRAREEAEMQGKDRVGTEHLLKGILAQKDGGAALVLRKLGADVNALAQDL